jgi:hypothetical protein
VDRIEHGSSFIDDVISGMDGLTLMWGTTATGDSYHHTAMEALHSLDDANPEQPGARARTVHFIDSMIIRRCIIVTGIVLS